MNIAIAGYAVEGEASYKYWNTPGNSVTIVDERPILDSAPEDAQVLLGEGVFSTLDSFDMVIRSAGLAPRKIVTDGKIWSATNEFFAECAKRDIQIIGVTGTKGKGTTCSLITSVLRAAGKTVHLVGNIGVPALEVLSMIQPDDIVVYELSSFQLWDLELSPQIAVVLMLEPDHLNVHTDMDEYIMAKAHIVLHQNSNDTVIYHPTNKYTAQIAQQGLGRKERYAVRYDGGVYVESNNFCVQGGAICSVGTLRLVGVHNQENACAAISAARTILPEITDEAIAEGLRNFTGLPHRLKFVREVNSVRYYDDSISTTPGSALAALRSFSASKIIILGGSDKGADYREVVEACRETGAQVVAIGQTGPKIAELCAEIGVYCRRYTAGDMKEIVRGIHDDVARPGDVVLLSPASASFGMFQNYADRGDQFVSAVEDLPSSD